MPTIQKLFKRIPYELKLIFVLFIVTRSLLTVVGVYSRVHATQEQKKWYEWNYSKYAFLDIWSAWDSGWYLDIAQNGYSTTLTSDLPKKTCCGQNNLGFFPLYPLSIRVVGKIIGNYHTAGILLSNIYLCISCLFLYKITKKFYGGVGAKSAVFVLLTFPTSFILSGIFSESLLIMLMFGALYYSIENKWLMASILGFFAALTKVSGVFLFFILLFQYFHNRPKKEIRYQYLWLLLIPLGILSYCLFNFIVFNDPLLFFSVKTNNFGAHFSNPLITIAQLFSSPNKAFRFIILFISIHLLIVIKSIRSQISPVFKLHAILYSVLPLISGLDVVVGYPRLSIAAVTTIIYLSSTGMGWYFYSPLLLVQLVLMSNFSNGFLII